MLGFIVNWLKSSKTFQEKNSTLKKGEFVNQLNELSLSILLKKKELESRILEKLDQQTLKTDSNSFLHDLKKDILSLQKLDFGKKVEVTQLQSEINHLGNILTSRHNELDDNELKLCAYFRMGFNTKEISAIEGLDLNTVRIHKIAIKRKLNIDSKTSLKGFLIFED